MRLFHCQSCDHTVFFENDTCVRCGHALGFDAEAGTIRTLVPQGGNLWEARSAPDRPPLLVQRCSNHASIGCNWLVPAAASHNPLCPSCRLTATLPDLSDPAKHAAWRKLENAKRRMLAGLHRLGLRPQPQSIDARGLLFEFLADPTDLEAEAILTGHFRGTITVNIAEADDAERERRRVALGEPYRTLLGHLRHETGHYYWDVLVAGDNTALNGFRALFGNEQEDYEEALERHYGQGPDPAKVATCITEYASAHPWEDWAETFAHYLHLCDGLGTAHSSGLQITPTRPEEPDFVTIPDFHPLLNPMETLLQQWTAVSLVHNNLNRSMGLPDGYPFIGNESVSAKLAFIHRLVQAQSDV